MSSWTGDYKWAAIFDRQIKMAIGPHVIGNASAEDDMEKATDLVLVTNRVRIACRMRRWDMNAHARYGEQFTIRSARESGTKTELSKILAGWGDLFFYGWGDPRTRRLREWSLIDLSVFRQHHADSAAKGKCIVAGDKDNGDGTRFIAYWIPHLPEGGIVASGMGLQLHDDSVVNA
jgi:hypothetical protein